MSDQLGLFAAAPIEVPADLGLRVARVWRGNAGVLVLDLSGKLGGRHLYADCAACGVTVPAGVQDDRRGLVVKYLGRLIDDAAYGACSQCGGPARLRAISLRAPNPNAPGRTSANGRWYCGGACLNGRHSCDCRCRGYCHGAGVCEGH